MLIEFFWIWDLYSTPPALAIDAMTTCASSKQTGGPVDALLLDCFVHSELSCHVHDYGTQLLLNCCCGFSLPSCRYVIYMYDISRPSEMLIASWADKCSRNASTSGEVGAGCSSCLWIIWWGYVYKFLCPCISGIWKEHRTKPCCQPQGIAWCKLLFYAKFSGFHSSLWVTEFSMLSYVHWVGMCNFPAWQIWRFLYSATSWRCFACTIIHQSVLGTWLGCTELYPACLIHQLSSCFADCDTDVDGQQCDKTTESGRCCSSCTIYW